MEFPLFKTKIPSITQKFDLSDFSQRQAYFEAKAGTEIEKLRNYLKENTFVAYLLGKKNSGKGTYSKMFQEVVSKERIDCFSIGDMVRQIDKILKNEKEKKELSSFLEKNYRGYLPLPEILKSLEQRNTKTLLPSELILALVKKEMAAREKKSLFIDGFPRNMDQVSYSLFFRDLIGYRDDPDVFVLIDVPEEVIDTRIKHRVVCPKCQTPRNLRVHAVKEIRYDEKNKNFYFLCDNPDCQNVRMVSKEGDELGIKPIRERLKTDEELMERAFSLYGIPKVFLRNSLPVEKAKEYANDYEITPAYNYQLDEKTQKIKVTEEPWVVKDDEGVPSFSLLPPAVMISMFKQMAKILNL